MMKSERPQQPQNSETEGLYLKSLDPGGCSWPFEDAISSSGITNAHIRTGACCSNTRSASWQNVASSSDPYKAAANSEVLHESS